jgi:peptide/nickel transport system substrate-binding protein
MIAKGRRKSASPGGASDISRRDLLALAALGMVSGAPGAAIAAGPEGQLTWGVHVSLAPIWFDPAEVSGIITPFMVLYALHDAMVKPMPGQPLAPCLAESLTASEDGLSYDFALRERALFHNGEPVTAEDVKFSFERYRGTARDLLKERVAAVEALDPRHVRFRLSEPWPDFLTFYGSASGAGWIVPKKYVEKVGDEGFKKAPIGTGPYKFVSFTPGIELVMEAFDQYWRKPPSVKRLVFKVIPEETTRLAALKRGEVDIVYSVRGELAEELQRTPGLTLKPAVVQGVFNIYFPDQWDPKSPWHDERVRRAASLAIDRDGINQAVTLGYSLVTGNPIVADHNEFFWQPPPPVYDPNKAKQLPRRGRLPEGSRRRRVLLRLVLRQCRRGGAR